MPEGPTIIVFRNKMLQFEGKVVTESDGYRNPYAEVLAGKKLLELKTYGKFLILQFKDFFITVHFGLFGSFLINDTKKVNPSFSLQFNDDVINFYVVHIKLIEGRSQKYFDDKFDPFSEKFDNELVVDRLLEKFNPKKIGDVLMNQEIFPGLGNVIRNEILFLAKIHPESTVEKIPRKKLVELIEEFKEFSKNSVELIEKKIWKSSSAVYQKKQFRKHTVEEYESSAIKRKTFYVKELQKKYV